FYLSWKARLNGYETKFIGLADEINRTMPKHVLTLLTDALNARRKAVNGARVLVLGVAYKRGVGDVRESPAIEIIEELVRKGAEVSYCDPFVPNLSIHSDMVLKAVELTPTRLQATDAVMILTDHRAFDYSTVAQHASLIVDTRNAMRGIEDPQSRIVRL
ncbi:MAG: UDP binding domain-containing protein, partial [bacterium]